MIQQNTKTEQWAIDSYEHWHWVKREDTACTLPGPPSAKMRGLSRHMQMLKDTGVKTVGYMDTSVSMAGWGISYFSNLLHMQSVLFYPEYKDGYRQNQAEYVPRWEEFGAAVCPLPHPTQHQINIHRAQRLFNDNVRNGVWLPNGLIFKETLDAVEEEAQRTFTENVPGTIVISVGSGVMLAGVMRGLLRANVRVQAIYGILVHRDTSAGKKLTDVLNLARFSGSDTAQLFSTLPDVSDVTDELEIIQTDYMYTQTPTIKCPFPCNPYYDLKAYEWMVQNYERLPKHIMLWNIGA